MTLDEPNAENLHELCQILKIDFGEQIISVPTKQLVKKSGRGNAKLLEPKKRINLKKKEDSSDKFQSSFSSNRKNNNIEYSKETTKSVGAINPHFPVKISSQGKLTPSRLSKKKALETLERLKEDQLDKELSNKKQDQGIREIFQVKVTKKDFKSLKQNVHVKYCESPPSISETLSAISTATDDEEDNHEANDTIESSSSYFSAKSNVDVDMDHCEFIDNLESDLVNQTAQPIFNNDKITRSGRLLIEPVISDEKLQLEKQQNDGEDPDRRLSSCSSVSTSSSQVERDSMLYCYCRKPSSKDLIGCDFCPQWYHPTCLNLSDESVKIILSLPTWRCPECEKIIQKTKNKHNQIFLPIPHGGKFCEIKATRLESWGLDDYQKCGWVPVNDNKWIPLKNIETVHGGDTDRNMNNDKDDVKSRRRHRKSVVPFDNSQQRYL